MARRQRLLEILRTRYPDETREQLLACVLCGEVRVDDAVIKDPKLEIDPEAQLTIQSRPYVSRGGLKLAHALQSFNIDVRDRVCLDAGASTGGFTDCLLQHGAAFVHAVDVGTNQLAYSLRVDPRVGVREQTSILDVNDLSPSPHFAVADLSFRSLRGAAAHLLQLSSEGAAVVLIKPQFEWIDPPDDFDGTVPGERALEIVLQTVRLLRSEGIAVRGICESPVTGRRGNREFLAWISRYQEGALDDAAVEQLLRS
jgi:23S rRNA (cytidine1920-2'-O)/16S rRNA (cytidine1409-2'-O)-methyltransferase